jgi:glycosyltransferase involved in cell wall biosynthesis
MLTTASASEAGFGLWSGKPLRFEDVGARAGVAVTMPAYNEQENLRGTVEDFLTVLAGRGVDHTVVVCNDGSSDFTGELGEQLADKYPGRVVVLHHLRDEGQPANRGYGAAVRSALLAGLLTGHQWVLSTDSDGQFRADDLPGFLEYAANERAELVLGYRNHRADSALRRLMGRGWTWATRPLLHFRARDVDCGYKLFWAASLAEVQDKLGLHGDAAVVSPEVVAKMAALGCHVLQRPVSHYPRRHGQQSGADLKVIARSLAGVGGIWLDLFSRDLRLGRVRRVFAPRDVPAYVVTLLAALFAVAGFIWYYGRNQTMLYPDAMSHLIIARRVIDSPTPGFGQLGGVWLPLPHVLALWGVWANGLFYSGIAGSAVSMLAYVVTARYLYKLGHELTGYVAAGAIAAGVFILNQNTLYMQSTPMTELVLFASITVGTYYLQCWCRRRDWRYLAAASAAALVGCSTRYETWAVLPFVLAVVALTEWSTRSPGQSLWGRLRSGRSSLFFFGFVGALAIPLWLAWCFLIMGNPLYFVNGSFAKPSLWVSSTEKSIGHLGVAANTYWIAVTDNLTLGVTVAALIGLVVYLVHAKLRANRMAPLTLLVLAPFFVYSLYDGQRPLHVPQIMGDYYNVRFGLIMILPAAVFAGYLARPILDFGRAWSKPLALAAVAAFAGALGLATLRGAVPTLTEGVAFSSTSQQQADAAAATWLHQHYVGGRVLMENFGNETVVFKSRITLGNIVYEGNNVGRVWHRALRSPRQNHIVWMYMRRTPDQDAVFRANARSHQLRWYELAYRGPNQLIYHLRGAPGGRRARLGSAAEIGQSTTRSR